MLTRHKSILVGVVILAACVSSNGTSWANKSAPPIAVGGGGIDNGGGTVTIGVGTGGSSGSGSAGGGGANNDGGGGGTSVPDPCRYTAIPVTDTNLWAGYDPSKGTLYSASCPSATPGLGMVPAGYVFAANNRNPVVPPDPAVLAQELVRVMNLPAPAVGMDPDPYTGYDRNKHNMPYTLVNIYTWFWDKAGFASLSKTAALNGVTATAVATPTTLTFDPGNGDASVACAGPGRAWTKSDGFNAPNDGGCGFMYRRVTANDVPIKATVTVTWTVSWTGSTGAAGTLPPLGTTTTTPAFLVEQVEVVNR